MMRREKIVSVILLLIVTSVGLSCKKDKNGDSGNYMTGGVTFNMPRYLLKSQQFTLTASGIISPKEGIEYTWIARDFSPDSVVAQEVLFTAPNEIGEYLIRITASHDDYSQTTSSRSTTVIDIDDPNSFSGVIKGENSIVDARDGRRYHYKKYGKLDWFTENLAWEGAGEPYNRVVALNSVLGSLYSWSDATNSQSGEGLGGGPKGACPEGWRVPTDQDWEDLAAHLLGVELPFSDSWSGLGQLLTTNSALNGENIWKYSPDNLKSNESEWNGLPGGSSNNGFKSFHNLGVFGFWWSATELNSLEGKFRYINFNSSSFPYNYGDKGNFAASVRCVRVAD